MRLHRLDNQNLSHCERITDAGVKELQMVLPQTECWSLSFPPVAN